MCGIAGWSSPSGAQVPRGALAAMSKLMVHRGPDDTGEFADPAAGIALAHRRLSIIDLAATSHQPMVDARSGTVLIYNGELYNFRELKAQLQARGHEFHSTGDTEVVLRSFVEWGPSCFGMFAGMFALAIWEPASRTLHLARDAMGMKPLYYIEGPQGLLFASEVKAFQAVPGFTPEVDRAALVQYLEFGYVFETGRTMLAGVRKLEPGHRLEISEGKITREEVWFTPAAPDPNDTRGEEERVAELGDTLDEVVGQHLIADVPIGLLLSGGLDSSVLAALAAKRGPLLTLTMGFDGSAIDERPNARAVSDFIGSKHVDLLITADEVLREAMEGAWVFDDLFADWGTISTRLLYRRCREQGIKAILVGEGADEIFGGYDVFRAPPRLGLWQQFRLYQKYAGRRHGQLFGAFRGVMQDYLAQSHGDSFHAIRLFEARRQLPNQYVMKVDKASMAESVEARAPYLDRRIAQIGLGTPSSWLLRNGENKYLLRALARRRALLPAQASGQAKFGAPLSADWMDSDPAFRKFARDCVLGGRWSEEAGLRGAMTSYFDQGRPGFGFPRSISIFRNLAWRVLLLELWSRHYLPARP